MAVTIMANLLGGQLTTALSEHCSRPLCNRYHIIVTDIEQPIHNQKKNTKHGWQYKHKI